MVLDIDQDEFFEEYGIQDDQFEKSGLTWNDIVEIGNHYLSIRGDLEPTAEYVVKCLRRVGAVHSLKYRIKSHRHLLEKIIRKSDADSSRRINIENYQTEITDLIGVRALHLFKGDWLTIHDFITHAWELHETPIAYVRVGDVERFTDKFKEKGCEVKEHPFGYRSVHYLIRSKPRKALRIIEIQVRTIFEEGWAEIDHRTRYPYDTNNPLLGQYLGTFNRLAGAADEMGTIVMVLKQQIDERNQERKAKDKKIQELEDELQNTVAQLAVSDEEKEELKQKIKALNETRQERASYELPSDPGGETLLSMDYPMLGGRALGLSQDPGQIIDSTISLAPETCSMCGKEIDSHQIGYGAQSGLSLCNDCSINAGSTVGLLSYEECAMCGKVIDSFVISQRDDSGQPICSTCAAIGNIDQDPSPSL